MTDQQSTQPRARTMAVQGAVNRLILGVLRTPGLNQLAGERLVTLYVVGRKTGRRFTIPVAYTKDKGDLLIGTPFGWGRNLRTGEPVEIRLKGRRRPADVRAYTDEADVVRLYAAMTKDNKNFANFNRVGFDPDGNPKAGDLHAAWLGGARAFRLTPR
jgi:deazaflavin-dependent oxidoreductase (nitroreductase family)